MLISRKILYIHEPTPLQCGQAVLAMLTEKSVDDIVSLCGTERETTLKDMKSVLKYFGIRYDNQRKIAESVADLPEVCILSLETPRCWHWSLYYNGTFYDPEHGVMDDFPICNRKYYWEIFMDKK